MTSTKGYVKYYRFLIYLAVIVLVNIAGLSAFFRIDLTSNGLYSLSEASKEVVRTLFEPLTINVFFTNDLPAPHNNTERYLHDLLEEYSAHSNRYFNYRFYNVSADEGDISEDARKNQQLARDYGIYPVQIQNIEQDEVKFKKAYMGMVMIHGDVIDKIPSITTTDGLEYIITSKIEKMNNKISVLLNLDKPVEIKLFLSTSLKDVQEQLRIADIGGISQEIESIIDELNRKYYGKLEFSRIDPTDDPALDRQAADYGVLTLRWPAAGEASGEEKRGSAGIVVETGGSHITIPLIDVVRIPLFGTQYKLADMNGMSQKLSEVIDDLLDINKKIGYLSGYGTIALTSSGQMPNQPPGQESFSNFNRLISEDYSVSNVGLSGEPVPDGIDCLIIAGPKKRFDDYDLFQIDQFLMKGKSLALFLDPFEQIEQNPNQRQTGYNQAPVFRPVDTGLDKLLDHYGVGLRKSYVLDEHCYEQRLPQVYGGGTQPIYYAPIIRQEKINDRVKYMNNIKEMISVTSSPVEMKKDRLSSNGLEGTLLFSSSDRSWEMAGRIDLNPMMIMPPDDPGVMKSIPMAVIISGEFPSYYAGKEVPEKPVEEQAEGEVPEGGIPETGIPQEETFGNISDEGTIIEKGKPGKLFVIGSAALLGNNVLDESGVSTNATFVMNLLDHLNGRDQYASMRSKMQRYNPLRESSGGVKTFVKSFNIAGLPVLVAALGIFVWLRRKSRKRAIEMMFRR
ncbi:MAG: Gldg family protein [Candidatus Krumholzibacteriota bacterium]|nr:Gldg family protein [Candidatus Krumholzibacteriota bacterium]